MAHNSIPFTSPITSPAAAGSSITVIATSLHLAEFYVIDATLQGATGGTLDVFLQRQVDDAGAVWADWLHFPQLAAGAGSVSYTVTPSMGASGITAVGTGTATTASPALAANTFIGGFPGQTVRAVLVAGSGTSAGAAQSITFRPWRMARV